MSTFLLWLNMLTALFAVATNIWAAFTGPVRTRPLAAAVAVLAATYVGCYAGVLSGWLDPDVRTAIAQGIAPVAFVVAWGLPALTVGRSYRHTLVDLRSLADRLPAVPRREEPVRHHVHH